MSNNLHLSDPVENHTTWRAADSLKTMLWFVYYLLLSGLVVGRRRRPFSLGVHRGGLLGHVQWEDDDEDDGDAVTPTVALPIIIYPPPFLPLPPHSLIHSVVCMWETWAPPPPLPSSSCAGWHPEVCLNLVIFSINLRWLFIKIALKAEFPAKFYQIRIKSQSGAL